MNELKMHPANWITYIENSIARALKHEGYIDASVLDIRGFSTGIMQRFWSLLCHPPIISEEGTAYIEVGLFGGKTACAAMNNNPTLHFYGIEDFSQTFGEVDIFAHLEENLAKYGPQAASCTIVNTDFKLLDLSLITRKCDIGFYDGEHGRENQAAALPKLLPVMKDTFVWLVDDYNWPQVEQGTEDSFKALEGKINIEWQKTIRTERPDCPVWHNGLSVAVISKL